MIALVTGGSGSGKSAWAERLAAHLSEEGRVYLATMRVWDAESERRVARHRAQRADLGFETVECPVNLAGVRVSSHSTVLLEDLPNLVANEMFDANGDVNRIVPGLRQLAQGCKNLIVVTNDIFADGNSYADSTREYMALLAGMNAEMAALADYAAEVVCTIPVPFKGQAFGPALHDCLDDGRKNGMKLYIGGAYQGQEELARSENPGAEIVADFHLLLKGFAGDPRAFAEDFIRAHPRAVVVADEVGCGVVPVDREERAWREAVGRALCVLARNSDQVTRAICGTGMRIK